MKIKDIINKDTIGKDLLQYKSKLIICDEFKDSSLSILNGIEEISYSTVQNNEGEFYNRKLKNILNISTYKLSDIKFNTNVRLYGIIFKNGELYVRCTKGSII